jgi:hypothetical protein
MESTKDVKKEETQKAEQPSTDTPAQDKPKQEDDKEELKIGTTSEEKLSLIESQKTKKQYNC